MITGAAIAAVQYSASILFCAILVRLLVRRPAQVRALATRIATVFGVICLAALYVWLEVGPEIDARLAAGGEVRLPPPAVSFAI